MGFFPALTVLFIALKLLGVITWSWIWVLSPLWGSFAIFVLYFMGVFWYRERSLAKTLRGRK